MDKNALEKILENHRHWLLRDCEGYESMRANLDGADLSEIDLSGANLRGVSLYRANLSGANLSEACLYNADLREANLSEIDLYEANLSTANFCGADLSGADLRGAILLRANLNGTILNRANLYNADLRGATLVAASLYEADLSEANLRGTNLFKTDLSEADLKGADLKGANFYMAKLKGAINAPFIPYACPDSGAFIGFKKAYMYIVVLEIPEDAKRLSATSRKCRCNKAKVLEIQHMDGSKADVNFVSSNYNREFIYTVGQTVSVPDFDEDRWNECSTGIHFFINRQEAVEY